jgi:hypothetical protein
MRRRFRAFGIALVAVALIALGLSHRDGLDLLDRSTRIVSVRGWGLERPDIDLPTRMYDLMSGGAQYQWVGNRQILFFHGLTPIQMTVTPGAGQNAGLHLDWPDSVGTPTLYDLATHREQPLSQLAALFQRSRGRAKEARVSPDGSRLLWQDHDENTHVAMLDASRHLRVHSQGGPGWLANSKQFYDYGWSEDTHKKSAIAIRLWNASDGSSAGQTLFTTSIDYALLGDCVLLPDGALATNTLHLPRIKLTLDRIAQPPNSVVNAIAPAVPADAQVESLVYSPRGDRLAWIISRSTPSPLAFLLRRLPHYDPTPNRTYSLWVSGVMGEHPHEIGHIPVRPGGRQYYLIDYVRWQPDEKKLSFVSNDTLYTVPAN